MTRSPRFALGLLAALILLVAASASPAATSKGHARAHARAHARSQTHHAGAGRHRSKAAARQHSGTQKSGSHRRRATTNGRVVISGAHIGATPTPATPVVAHNSAPLPVPAVPKEHPSGGSKTGGLVIVAAGLLLVAGIVGAFWSMLRARGRRAARIA
jgi:hypothetical protein